VRYTEDSDLWTRIALEYYIPYCNKPLALYNLEIPNNSNSENVNEYYYVIDSLESSLFHNKVPLDLRASVIKYINYQKLSFIKRCILKNNKFLALRKLASFEIFFYNPFQSIMLIFLLLIPKFFLNISYIFFRKNV
jgi:hypothetical protein